MEHLFEVWIWRGGTYDSVHTGTFRSEAAAAFNAGVAMAQFADIAEAEVVEVLVNEHTATQETLRTVGTVIRSASGKLGWQEGGA